MSDKGRENKIELFLDRIHDSRVKQCPENNNQSREEFVKNLHKKEPKNFSKSHANTRPERQLDSERHKQNIMARYLAREKMLQRYLSRT